MSPPPFWSFDSRFVVYGAQGKLRKSEITGTPAQSIADTGLPFVQGGTWNREGVIVYARNAGIWNRSRRTAEHRRPVTMLAPEEIRTPVAAVSSGRSPLPGLAGVEPHPTRRAFTSARSTSSLKNRA